MTVGHCVCLAIREMECEMGGNSGLIPIVIVIVIVIMCHFSRIVSGSGLIYD